MMTTPGLRDNLAIERTALANERTMLAYLRSALALGAAGATFIKFFETLPFVVAGFGLLVLSLAILGVGLLRFLSAKRRIAGSE